MGNARPYDIVLFGATGFTGGLTAAHLARHAPAGCRWALAGRDRDRLAAVRARLADDHPELAELPLLVADAADAPALRRIAGQARVVVSTVGPYLRHGEPLVAACAEAGTGYLDLTGEPEFVDLMYLRYHERAAATGARLVHSCGFDSVPHDLGVLFTVGLLPPGVPLTVRGYVRAGGTISGGTLASTLLAFSRPAAMLRAARDRRAAEPRPDGRRVRAVTAAPGWSPQARAWTLPLPTIDGQVVARSAAADPAYGPDFRYAHQAAVKWLPVAAAGVAAVGLVVLAAQLPPLRAAFGALRKPGRGPDAERRARGWFAVRFVGEGGGRRVVTEVGGGDPGYTETAVMLGESALCMAFDPGLPAVAGQLTPATAFGPALIDRLTAAGIRFTVLDAAPRHAPGPVPR